MGLALLAGLFLERLPQVASARQNSQDFPLTLPSDHTHTLLQLDTLARILFTTLLDYRHWIILVLAARTLLCRGAVFRCSHCRWILRRRSKDALAYWACRRDYTFYT